MKYFLITTQIQLKTKPTSSAHEPTHTHTHTNPPTHETLPNNAQDHSAYAAKPYLWVRAFDGARRAQLVAKGHENGSN